jgi:hypothetical protein
MFIFWRFCFFTFLVVEWFSQSPKPQFFGVFGLGFGFFHPTQTQTQKPIKAKIQPKTQSQYNGLFWVLKFRKTGFFMVYFNFKLFCFISIKILNEC